MIKKLDLISTISAALFVGIYILAEYATVNPESWAKSFVGAYPISIGFGVLAIILQVTSRYMDRKVLTSGHHNIDK